MIFKSFQKFNSENVIRIHMTFYCCIRMSWHKEIKERDTILLGMPMAEPRG